MCRETRWTAFKGLLGGGVAALLLTTALYAGDQPGREDHSGQGMHQPEPEKPDSRAQSGAEAADEARIYTAQLRRCEGLEASRRDTCVAAAKRRLGQL